jgi:hypothetical protein
MHDGTLITTLLHDAQGVINGVYRSSTGEAPRALIPGQSVGPVVPSEHPAADNPMAHRIVGGEAVERDEMTPIVSTETIAADGSAQCVITGLPEPCRVTITGAVQAGPVEVSGGTLTLTSTQPGAIRVAVTADPACKAWEVIIHAA